MRILFSVALFASILFAHKLNVFAYEEEGVIKIKSYFTKSSPCIECKVESLDSNKLPLAEAKTDRSGEATLPMDAKVHALRISEPGGHATIIDYAVETKIEDAPQKDEVALPLDASMQQHIDLKITEAKNEILEAINEREEENDFQKIIGGIGYIVGIFGLFALLYKRR